MSTVASMASCVAGAVSTGERAIVETGASACTPPPAIRARTSASPTIPSSPPSRRTSSADTPSWPRRCRASRTGAAGSQNTAGRMIADTGVVPTSCRPWTVVPARVRRFRIVWATYAAPASVPRMRRPAAGANSAQVEGSRARTVKAGAIWVSSEGWPKHSPGSSTWISSDWWKSPIDPVMITHSPAAGAPSSTSTSWPGAKACSVTSVQSRSSSSGSIPSNGAYLARNVSKCSMSRASIVFASRLASLNRRVRVVPGTDQQIWRTYAGRNTARDV